MDSAKTQLAERLKTANNILVTVSRNPSVDQLAACLGLTLLLNKLNKHSVAVFSGQVPSTIEFLKPQETLEKTTDSLRDFIIALDKDKADKLRYKVEDNVVRIFITPYKTSITEEDLEFSQGDFNVDVVIALGVKQQEDLDEAITAHGRILHDATVASINLSQDAGLGTISWNDPHASSLSELVTDLVQLLGDNKLLDNQIATALLTGIVAETDRFSNDKTSSQTMNASSALMAAGANQQLVASKLEKPDKPKQTDKPSDSADQDNQAKTDPGTLNISHDQNDQKKPEPAVKTQPPAKKTEQKPPAENYQPPKLLTTQPPQPPAGPGATTGSNLQPGAKLMTEPPSMGGTLSANTKPESLDPITDPMSLPQSESSKLVGRPTGPPPKFTPPPQMTPPPTAPPSFTPPPAVTPAPPAPMSPPPAAPAPPPASDGTQTLTEIEQSVHSPHVGVDTNQLDTARDEVSKALKESVDPMPSPMQALGSQPLGGKLHPDGSPAAIQPSSSPVLPLGPTPAESSDTNPRPSTANDLLSPSPQISDPTAAPPVAPPLTQEAINNANNPPSQPPPAL